MRQARRPRDHGSVEPAEIRAAFEAAFDHALLYHGFADHLRDYDLFVRIAGDRRLGESTRHVRYRFRHCVRATATTALTPEIWQRSLDDRLLTHAHADRLGGFVWGVKWQNLYPGMALKSPSDETERWAGALGIPFHEATVETNGHNLSLIFSDLMVDHLPPGHIPFAVPDHGAAIEIHPL
jgi:hypothetical protein